MTTRTRRCLAVTLMTVVVAMLTAAPPVIAASQPRAQTASPSSTSPASIPGSPPSRSSGAVAPSTTTPTPVQPSTTISAQRPSFPPTPSTLPEANWWEPSFFNPVERLTIMVNNFLAEAIGTIADQVLDWVGHTLLATPPITRPTERAHDLWQVSVALGNSLFVVFIVIGGVLLMGYETVQTSYAIKDVAPRLVLAFVQANLSLWLVDRAIEFANALSRAFLGSTVTSDHIAAMLAQGFNNWDLTELFSLIMAFLVLVLLLALVAFYIVRVALLHLLVATGPIALLTYALPYTDGIARLWWRLLAADLGAQVIQAALLALAAGVFFPLDQQQLLGLDTGSTLIDLLVTVCLAWLLIQVPVWLFRMALGTGRRRSTVARMARSYLVLRGVRSLGGGR